MAYPEFESVNKLLERTMSSCWSLPSLSNYQGESLSFRDVAWRISILHNIFRTCALEPGDRVAICGKNHVNWAVAMLSSLTYGAVAVPLLHEFKPANIHHLVSHSESKVLFADEQILANLDLSEMPGLVAVVRINDLAVTSTVSPALEMKKDEFAAQLSGPVREGFSPADMAYYEDKAEDIAIINYTSGTSGFSKGVVLPYLSLWSNLYFAVKVQSQMVPGSRLVSILPSAHMYGLMFEFLYQFSRGVHIYFLTRIPSPRIMLQAMQEVKPNLIISVPLVIEKIYKAVIEPKLRKPSIKFMRRCVPFFEYFMLRRIRGKLIDAFGGCFDEIIIGGAAFNREVETFFHKMKFPFTVGYGMTECGPIITYERWCRSKVGSSGRVVPNMELRVESPDPMRVPGEILCRGANVFNGYFKNDEETAKVFTPDGWFRTGDMGVIDADGYLFIKGRSKCMILGPSGQNIYPEEIEAVLNNLRYVVETLVVDGGGGNLTALVYPDWHKAQSDGIDAERLRKLVTDEVEVASSQLEKYCRIKKVEVLDEDFERTPKKSIKRYLYQK